MAYQAGDTITGAQYNIFVNNSSSPFGYNHFAGTGSGNYGLGQTHIATVTGGSTTITAAQFNSLFTGMTNIANHTNDTLTSAAQVSAGSTIAIRSALEADLASLAAEVAAGSTSATALTTSSALQTVTSSSGWGSSATSEISATFASADALRHFFNAGGKIRFTMTANAESNSSNVKDQSFIDMGSALGNIDIAAHSTTRSGSGETLTTNGLSNGFHNLSDSYTVLIKLTSDNSNYTSNTVEVSAKLNAAVGSATVLTVKCVSTDPAGDTTYTGGNTDGVGSDPKKTPAIVTKIFSIDPNNSEGLAAGIAPSSTATVTNSTS